jgi:hypothetical protein
MTTIASNAANNINFFNFFSFLWTTYVNDG